MESSKEEVVMVDALADDLDRRLAAADAALARRLSG